MTFQIGNKVRFKWDEAIGEVLEVRDDNVSTGPKYLIKWQYSRCAPDWEHGDELILVDIAKDKELADRVQAKVNEATVHLEQAWQAWNTARELANQESSWYYLEKQDLIDIGSFGNIAENFGWSASSLHC